MDDSSETGHPGKFVRAKVIPKGMTVTEAAKILGIGRPALSNFLNGNAALSPEMAARLQKAFGADADKLVSRQAAYDSQRRSSDRAVMATTRAFVPPFLMVRANDIEEWANRHEARAELAVLLRTLVHSTCGGLKLVDFPGYDDAQRPGWDGRVKTDEGNPWVPEGSSRWEFGTSERVGAKATDDYAKRTDATDPNKRKDMAFVFVTPQRWPGKESWLSKKRAEGKWRTVIALDASDLEQWLEQSIPGQVWFVRRLGRETRGVKSLDRCWVEWSANCKHAFNEGVFAEACLEFRKRIVEYLQNDTRDPLRIVADSHQEGLAFLAALFSRQDEELCGFRDRMVVFTETGVLSGLLVGSPDFIPIVESREVERELVQNERAPKSFVIEPRTAVSHDPSVITLNPLSHRAFREALKSMGLGDDEIDSFERESGKSLTVLRRRLSGSGALRSPEWSADENLAQWLIPMMLAGAWRADNDADRYLMGELAGYADYDQLEIDFTRLLNLEDSPVWAVGSFCGVVSKIDSLYGAHRWMTAAHIERFIEVAELVLSERDPALDLDRDERWAAVAYGKSREISSPLREGIAETLVLLAIHGGQLFEKRLGLNPEQEVAALVRRLLEPLRSDTLLSQSPNLPFYAEAAPEMFLWIFERDLSSAEPAVSALMHPAGNLLFHHGERADLLWALELLAWHPKWLDRIVHLLAALAALEPDDNLSNRPSESLQAIFRSWMPQTAAPVDQRIAVLDRLVERHPTIAWRIAISQFEPGSRIGGYSRKPDWRDDARGFGEPITRGESNRFIFHCIQVCLGWRPHTRETLADLMRCADLIRCAERSDTQYLSQLGEAVKNWASSAGDEDRAWLRERIRVSVERKIRRKSREATVSSKNEQAVIMAQNAFDVLEPADPVWKHAWLFRNTSVPESWDELEDRTSQVGRDERIEQLRVEAIREVLDRSGLPGLLRLAFSGNGAKAAGWSISKAIEDETARADFLQTVLEDGDILTSAPHQTLVSGFLRGLGAVSAIPLVEEARRRHGPDIGVKLLCLCSFDRSVWSKVEEAGGTIPGKYWAEVQPRGENPTDENLNYVVAHLIAAGRPGAAMNYAQLDWEQIESRHICRILENFPKAHETDYHYGRADKQTIRRAFEIIGQRQAFSRARLARLEFLYLDLFWIDGDGLPNLEQEIETNPELFCEAVATAYRPKNKNQSESDESEKNRAQMAYRLLMTLSQIPGHDEDGNLASDKILAWIDRVRSRCDDSGHIDACDHHIGQLLSNAPVGDDGVWPCIPVREVLETILNDEVKIGFRNGRYNARGVQLRLEGGGQERELARQYEDWAKACVYSYPKVADALHDLKSSYERDARWWDQDAEVERRLGY